jgi:signal peptidase I
MSGHALLGVLLSIAFPGLGQGLAAHRWRMIGWAVGLLVATLLVVVSVWFLALALVLRVAGAIDAYRCLRRAGGRPHHVNAAIALVIGAVGIGYVKLAVEGFKIPSSSMYPALIIGDHIFVDKLSPRWRPIERGEIVVFTQPCSKHTFVKRVIARGGDTVEVRCSKIFVNGSPVAATLVDKNASYQDYDEHDGKWFYREVSRYRETLGGHTYETFHDRERPPGEQTGEDGAPRGDFPARDRMFAPSCTQGGAFFDAKPGEDPQPTGRLVETQPDASGCEPQAHFEVPAGTLFMMGDNRNNANDSRYWGVVRERAVVGRLVGIWMSNGIEGGWGRVGAIE